MKIAHRDQRAANKLGTFLSWLVLALGLALLFAGGGYWYYRVDSAQERTTEYQTLKAVADLKVKLILSWRNEHLADARVVALNPMSARAAQDLRAHPGDRALKKAISTSLASIVLYHGYANPRDGDEALIINELRFMQRTALTLRFPLTDVRRLAVQAVSGKRGLADGLNYRGREVVAQIAAVPDSDWVLIAMEDRDEVTAGLQSRGRLIGLLAAFLACLSGAGVGFLFLRQRKNIYKRLFYSERERVEALGLFRTTLYSIGDGIITSDAEGKVRHLNRAAEAMTGWKEQEARGRPVHEVFRIVNQMTRDAVEDPIGRVLREGTVVQMANHTLLIARDGTERPIADSGSPILSPQGECIGVVLVFRDQTQQRQAEQAVRESETRYRSLFDSMEEGVALHRLVCDEDGHPIDYEIVDVNPAYARQTGLSAEAARGVRASLLYGTGTPPFLEQYERVARGGAPISFETLFAPLNRTFQISVFSPKEGWFATVFSDITSRKRMESELANEKERLSVTLRSIGDGVIATDVDSRVVLMNKVAESLTGWEAENAIGRHLGEVFFIVNAGLRERCKDPVERVLRSGTVVGLANHTILIARDGRECVIADSGSPIRDREGGIIGVVLVFRDVTLKEKLEEDLLRSEKLESLSVLAGGIAHDFNNILSGILGNVSLAATELLGNTPVRELIQEAETACIRAKDLTQQLLTFAKGGAPIKRLCDGAAMIREAAGFARHGSAISCRYEIAHDLWPIEADEGQFVQVIHNVVINSVQAMPTGGTITITAVNVSMEEANQFLLAAGPYLKVSIGDEGVGIPEDLLPRIFDPYFTTKQGGSGLGLATCYSIVKKHEGRIEVTSVPGAGTTFAIYLPAAPGRQLQPGERRSSQIEGKGRRILVMDDEEPIRKIATAILRSMGFDVETSPEGAKAVELYRDAKLSGRPFDAVIMDLTVAGGIGGREAIVLLRKLDASAKVIVSSGYSSDSIIANYREFGFQGALAKPYSLNEVKSVLQEVLGE